MTRVSASIRNAKGIPFYKLFSKGTGFFIRALYGFSAKRKLMRGLKILVRTLFVFILLTGLAAGLLVSTLASVHAAPNNLASPGDMVISEFRFHGSGGASDEFAEILNRSGGVIDLNGWKVKGSNNSGATSIRFTFVTNVLLSPGQRYLLANTGYNDAISPDGTYSVGITDG